MLIAYQSFSMFFNKCTSIKVKNLNGQIKDYKQHD